MELVVDAMKTYRNKIPGDYSTEIVEVPELPDEYKKVSEQIKVLDDIVKKGEEAKHQVIKLVASCKHEYFHDEEGWMYNPRYCDICGRIVYFV